MATIARASETKFLAKKFKQTATKKKMKLNKKKKEKKSGCYLATCER